MHWKKENVRLTARRSKAAFDCKSCSIMSGFGGAGAFSDGKYNITNDFGGTLYEYIGKEKALELMQYVDEINMEHGGEGTRLYSTAGTKFKKLCLQNRSAASGCIRTTSGNRCQLYCAAESVCMSSKTR